MNRRQFLRRTLPAASAPFLLGGFALRAYGQASLLETLPGGNASGRVLVIIQLNGGNDGLNTLLPLDQYAQLASARPNILLPESGILPLTDTLGFHPSMPGMAGLFAGGRLAIVQGVSYPNPDFSHFRATDIWFTASDSEYVEPSGWLGRYLDRLYPRYPDGYPSAEAPHPLGIQVGQFMTAGFTGPSSVMGISVSDPDTNYLAPGGDDVPPATPAGDQLQYIRRVSLQAEAYSGVVREAAARARNRSTLYPTAGKNSLADQLAIVARLVAGGLQTSIYVVNLGGFDTHSGQVEPGGPETGMHAQLLGRLSEAVAAFQDDLRLLGVDQRVLGMTFSEFGRRIKSNASYGTDHGTAAPLFLFGTNVNAGVVGSNPVLPARATVTDNLSMQHDFRSVYATLLRDWLGAREQDIQATLPRSFATLPLVTPSAVLDAPERARIPVRTSLEQNYPNPFNSMTVISYNLARPSQVNLMVYDVLGRQVRQLINARQEAGRHEVRFDATGLPSGMYIYRLRAGESSVEPAFEQTRKLLLVR